MALEAEKNLNNKNFQKNLKKIHKKIAKVCDIEKLKNYSTANKNLSATYDQTP